MGLDLFRSAHLLLLPQFHDIDDSSAEGAFASTLESKVSEETISSLHHLPMPYLCLMLLGLRLKNSLRTETIRQAFDGQEVTVDRCLEFLEIYLRLSPKLDLASLKNDSDERIFEFTLRMYFMQVGDPLQLMRHFTFFLGWGNPSKEVAAKILRAAASNPLLNPIERLNYVILMAASSAIHPMQNAETGEYLKTYSIRDAIATIESSAAQLSSAVTDEADEAAGNGNVASDEVVQGRPPRSENAAEDVVTTSESSLETIEEVV